MSTTDNSKATSVLLAGVGGQGTILAADLLAKAAIAHGLDVKLSEIHGMAQRGGAVTTAVRFGTNVKSMVIDPASADCLLSFETTEALRNLHFVKPGGMILVNNESIKPLPVATGRAAMPARIGERLADAGARLIPATALAIEAGSPRCANVVLLGALSTVLPFEVQNWCDQIAAKVPPKTIEMNIEAFHLGRQAALD